MQPSGRSQIALDLLKHHGRLARPAVIGFLMEQPANPPARSLSLSLSLSARHFHEDIPVSLCRRGFVFFSFLFFSFVLFFFPPQSAFSSVATLSIFNRESESEQHLHFCSPDNSLAEEPLASLAECDSCVCACSLCMCVCV